MNTPKKIKVGDVVLNHYASENNPHRKSIVIQLSSSYNGYYKCITSNSKGGTDIIEFSRMDLVTDPKFEIIDHIDFLEILK